MNFRVVLFEKKKNSSFFISTVVLRPFILSFTPFTSKSAWCTHFHRSINCNTMLSQLAPLYDGEGINTSERKMLAKSAKINCDLNIFPLFRIGVLSGVFNERGI